MTLHPLDAETAIVGFRYAVETNQVSRERWRRANRPLRKRRMACSMDFKWMWVEQLALKQ